MANKMEQRLVQDSPLVRNALPQSVAAVQDSDSTLEFDAFAPSLFIKIKNRAGHSIQYEIRESDGGPAYWQFVADLARFRDGTAISDYKDGDKTLIQVQEDLISQCLFQNGVKVELERIRNDFGMKAKQKLFDLCYEVNGNKKEAVDEMGKDSGNAELNGTGSALPNNSAAPSEKPSNE